MPEAINPHAPWKLPIIVPLWILQIVLAAVYLVGVPIIARTNYPPWNPSGDGIDASTFVIVLFSFAAIIINAAEITLFVKHKLNTRRYLLCQWGKATLAGVTWVIMELLIYTHWRWKRVGEYSVTNFVFQHPALIACLYYSSRAYSKYGGDAGGQVPGEGGDANESSPLLRGDTEDV